MAKKKEKPEGGIAAAYPEGMPLDENGQPLLEGNISEDQARELGVFDLESARIKKIHDDTMARKAAGDSEVRWNADPRIRYMECIRLNPQCWVEIEQIEPVKDDNIDPKPVTILKDYGELTKYIRESHWDGQRAAYKWILKSQLNPQHAYGIINFKADPAWKRPGVEGDNMARGNGNQQQPPWMQQWNPQQPQWGYQQPMMPVPVPVPVAQPTYPQQAPYPAAPPAVYAPAPTQVAAPQQPPPPAPAPAPTPPPQVNVQPPPVYMMPQQPAQTSSATDPNTVQMLLQQLERQSAQTAALQEELRQQRNQASQPYDARYGQTAQGYDPRYGQVGYPSPSPYGQPPFDPRYGMPGLPPDPRFAQPYGAPPAFDPRFAPPMQMNGYPPPLGGFPPEPVLPAMPFVPRAERFERVERERPAFNGGVGFPAQPAPAAQSVAIPQGPTANSVPQPPMAVPGAQVSANPIAQMREGISMLREVTNMSKALARELAPEGPKEPPPFGETDPALSMETDEDSPIKIKEMPHMRLVYTRADKNAPWKPADWVTTAMTNGDKLAEVGKGILTEIRTILQDRRRTVQEQMYLAQQAMLLQQQKAAMEAGHMLPPSSFGMQQPGYVGAPQQYGQPQYAAPPRPQYAAPPQPQYAAPQPQYAAPPPQQQQYRPQYVAPQPPPQPRPQPPPQPAYVEQQSQPPVSPQYVEPFDAPEQLSLALENKSAESAFEQPAVVGVSGQQIEVQEVPMLAANPISENALVPEMPMVENFLSAQAAAFEQPEAPSISDARRMAADLIHFAKTKEEEPQG